MSRLEAEVIVFDVSPLADPTRGGRWVSIQLWADKGTIQVRQLSELKWRLETPEGHDPTDEIQALTRALVAIGGRERVADRRRNDTVTLGDQPLTVGVLPSIPPRKE